MFGIFGFEKSKIDFAAVEAVIAEDTDLKTAMENITMGFESDGDKELPDSYDEELEDEAALKKIDEQLKAKGLTLSLSDLRRVIAKVQDPDGKIGLLDVL